MDETEIIWTIINKYYQYNPNFSVKHHLDSYNNFFTLGIKRLFLEKNPIRIVKEAESDGSFKYQCNLFMGGKTGDRIYYGKPIIYDDNNRIHFMYPNEARLRNMTYGFSIHYDVDIDFIVNGKKKSLTLEKIYLGRFPIMLQSNLCILNGLSREVRFNMGECRNDWGGYFIIDGKEKVIIPQEKFADNMLYIHPLKDNYFSHSAEIRSVSEDASKPIRTLYVQIVQSSELVSRGQIVVSIPNVKEPIPLFIVMRALGIISDKDIIETCLLNLEKEEEYLELFRPSIYNAGYIFSQAAALKYIATFIKLSVSNPMEILSLYFLPHIGELNFKQKAFFLGYMVKRLLDVFIENEPPTDRDSFTFKRIETTGELIYKLFREYYNLEQAKIFQNIDKEYYYHTPAYQDDNFYNLIENNISLIFSSRIVEDGFKKGFKGNWGAQSHTKRLGVIQDLSRLSYFSFISHLRKLNVPLDSSAKVVGPRLLHGTQWGKQCPIHTPDGGNIGLHKHLTVMSTITSGTSGYLFISWLRSKGMILLEEATAKFLSLSTKIFINGAWAGVVNNPSEIQLSLKLHRRNGFIPIDTSICWNIMQREIIILTDKGRLIRPIFYMYEPTIISWERRDDIDKASWTELVSGFYKKKKELFSHKDLTILKQHGSIIDWVDAQEEEGAFIAIDRKQIIPYKTTHVEIHPSLILGIMANQIIFPENNPLPRDLFSCGQSKQAVSVYNSNYHNRIDKMGIILNSGQIPLLKSRYLKFVTNEQHPYGENAIVAIACYSGYNVEDAIIINQAAVDRGLFRTTYFNMYESREESEIVVGTHVNSNFCNILDSNVIRLKSGYDYSFLDRTGLIRENTKVNDKTVLIGKCITDINDAEVYSDASVVPKKGQLGYIDKSFMTEADEGFRLAKIRIRHERMPTIGDKFCSRAGQKGTIGIILPEVDMPFTKDGLRPDIIVNPHAFPSRMTIGHLIESLIGKVCTLYGTYSDCTAFVNKGPKHIIFGKMLTKQNFHSSGTEVLYNGMNGKQIEADIYFGPTYYLRLKHMVKDKINFRARGPRTLLTRQTVQGRANNGGLRVGEMDRDAIIASGMSEFLNESFMVRGDEFYIAVCNQTGSIAIYNESKNLFLSPMCDGPLQFTQNLKGDLNIKQLSKFGRDFSIIRIPYSFKLLYQELKTMNIQMRIITEKNVKNLTTIVKGDNITKLTKLNNIIEVIQYNVSKITGKDFTKVPKPRMPKEEEAEWNPPILAQAEETEDIDDMIIVFTTKNKCKQEWEKQFEAYNPRLLNVKTDIPYVLDRTDLIYKIVDNLLPLQQQTITVKPFLIQFPTWLTSWTNQSKVNTLEYMFYKIRSGYFIQIKEGTLKRFIPFYNVHFKNTWGHMLNIDKIKDKSRINQNRDQWTATNCLVQLTFKPLIDQYQLDTFMEVRNMFSELCLHKTISDIDLFVNVKDFPLLKKDLTEPFNHIYNAKNIPITDPKKTYYPILSFNSNDTFTDIPIPTNHEWSVVTQKVFPARCLRDYIYPKRRITWPEKQATAVFRGTATGCSYTIDNNPRLLAAKLDKEWAAHTEEVPYLDAGITKFPNRYKTIEGNETVFYSNERTYVKEMKKYISMKKPISMQNQLKYKYILNIPGNSAAYRLSFLLRSGSVILNVQSENTLWWESLWEVNKHYIPIKSDLSDLKEKIKWCRDNDDKCLKIVANAKAFADKYISKEGIFDYLEQVIYEINANISKEVSSAVPNADDNPEFKALILVPYRGGNTERVEHLKIFKQKMAVFIPLVIQYLKTQGVMAKFDIHIIEQSPEHPFNRGALLNIGFKETKPYDVYIFQDVDLIPEASMIPVYGGSYNVNSIAHFASEWVRYKNPFNYLGGVLLVGREMFKKLNGFPNNYFGWGGRR